MSALFDPLTSDESRLDRLALVMSCFCVLLPLFGLLAPKAVVPLAFVAAISAVSILGAQALPWSIVDRPASLAVGLLIAWCLVASAWSYRPFEAAVLALRIGVLLFVLLYLCAVAGLLDSRHRRGIFIGLGFGLAVTILLAGVEFAFGFPLFTLLKGPVGNDYHAFSRLNRGVSTLAILVWPLAAFCWLRGYRALAVTAPLVVLAVTLASESLASVVGLGAGLIAAAFACLGRTAGRLILASAMVVALIGSPGAAKLMKQHGLEQADYLPSTSRYRVQIWDFVTDRFLERPALGWGFDSASSIPPSDTETPRGGRKVIPSHPHNGALQILLELGLPGGLLAGALLFLIGRKIDAMIAPARVCATALFVTILAIASAAYGMWQSHWLTVIGTAAAILVAALPESSKKLLPTPDPDRKRDSARETLADRRLAGQSRNGGEP